MSLLANDSFMKHVNKDPEGYGKDHAWKRNSFSSMLLTYYGFKPKKKKNSHSCVVVFVTVPISVIASTKKIKSLVNINNTILTQALRSSSRLVRLLSTSEFSISI